jgi:hypothetical protein
MKKWLPISLTSLALLIICVVLITSTQGTATAALIVAAVLLLANLVLQWWRSPPEDAELSAARTILAVKASQFERKEAEFEQLRSQLLREVITRAERLDEHERDLLARFARFREFLEYPVENVQADYSQLQFQQLGEKDRQVHALLEAESERVYRKLRKNEYSVDGKVDVKAIREESLHLIREVARIYKPDCDQPLLETSFEQLARAASRICLHLLVLLERLPVSVQHYNISTLYSYMRKATMGYDVYQKASPWLTYLSRGIYAGRLAATASPVTLGAWWLATELGKRGAQKVVENVVDKQAVAILHDIVAVIGVEAAGIYGTGFRQRDPAWVMGTELVELIRSFPPSGDSLRHGLRQITALPLRSEYDRIYLYRCLAEHRSAGLHLSEPATLNRENREAIARTLEQFFAKSIHGTKPATIQKWRDAAEARLDLRLNLEGHSIDSTSSRAQQLESAAKALASFLGHIVMPAKSDVAIFWPRLRIASLLTPELRSQIETRIVSGPDQLPVFEPPELDPSADLTDLWLRDLTDCCVRTDLPEANIEQLVIEAWTYFRRSSLEARTAIQAAWKSRLCELSPELEDETLPNELARGIFEIRNDDERVMLVYGDLQARVGETVTSLPETWLLGLRSSSTNSSRLIAVRNSMTVAIIWELAVPCRVDRRQGILIDDAVLSGGKWHESLEGNGGTSSVQHLAGADLVVSGSLRGGRFKSGFRKLLEFCQPSDGI